MNMTPFQDWLNDFTGSDMLPDLKIYPKCTTEALRRLLRAMYLSGHNSEEAAELLQGLFPQQYVAGTRIGTVCTEILQMEMAMSQAIASERAEL